MFNHLEIENEVISTGTSHRVILQGISLVIKQLFEKTVMFLNTDVEITLAIKCH